MGHAYVSPLRRWEVIAQLCEQANAETYIEVGCKEGRTTGFVLGKLPGVRAIAIDPWKAQEKSADASRETYEDWDFAEIEAQFHKNIGANAERCKMLRFTSLGSHSLCDEADVIFLDASHDYASVKQDIDLWWPKVKQGGYLVMHDYNHKWPGVMRAVAECFCLFDVNVAPDSVAYVQKRRPQ